MLWVKIYTSNGVGVWGLVGGDMGVEATSASNWVEVEAEAELRDLVFLWFEVNSQWLRINSLITLNVKPIKYLSQAYSRYISVLTQVRLRHQGIPIWGGTPLRQDLSPPPFWRGRFCSHHLWLWWWVSWLESLNSFQFFRSASSSRNRLCEKKKFGNIFK